MPRCQAVKVLVLTMFEDAHAGRGYTSEFRLWHDAYFKHAEGHTIKGFPNPLFLDRQGIAGCVTGMGKAQSASTLTAVLSDERFDFSRAYIIVSGCAGITPERGTLGDVVWADALVDFDLGYAWQESGAGQSMQGAFARDRVYDRSGYFSLNRDLVSWAHDLTKNCPIKDQAGVAAYRLNYPQGNARSAPSVRRGVSVTGDSFWHGKSSSARAEAVCAAYGTDSPYLVMQMEDNAFGVVARNFGLLDRLLISRDAVNFDQPYEGQSVAASLAAESGGFDVGMINGFIVASKVVDTLITGWKTYADEAPSIKNK